MRCCKTKCDKKKSMKEDEYDKKIAKKRNKNE